MNDDSSQLENGLAVPPGSQEAQTGADTLKTPGQWLRTERERQGRTVQEIAADMNLGVPIVEAIELDQFSALGAPVFARGHLRKYAALLGLPVEEVAALYQSVSDRPRDQDPVPVIHRRSEPSIPMRPDSKERRSLPGAVVWLVLAAAVLAALVAVIWWRFARAPHARAETAHVTVPAAIDSAQHSVASAVPQTPAKKADGPVQPTVTSASAVAVAKAPPTAAAVAEPAKAQVDRPKISLHFAFAQESWVEVYDAHGTRLLYDVGAAGQARNISVEPPAQVVLGVAAAVAMRINGRDATIPSRHIVNQVARFTVGANGQIQ